MSLMHEQECYSVKVKVSIYAHIIIYCNLCCVIVCRIAFMIRFHKRKRAGDERFIVLFKSSLFFEMYTQLIMFSICFALGSREGN